MVVSFEPDFSPALRELERLRTLPPVDVRKALDHLMEAGLPLLVGEIDDATAVGTGNVALTCKFSDAFGDCLAAVRAEKIEAEAVEV